MTKFKVGDKVQVVKPGNSYTTYYKMFEKLGFKDTVQNDGFQEGLVAEVFVVGEHLMTQEPLLGLQAKDGSQSLISAEGVVKVYYDDSSDDEFDIIRQFCDEVLRCENVADKTIYKYLLKKVASSN